MRDGIKSVATLGAPPETDWPYDPTEFAVKPPLAAYADAMQDLVSAYMRVTQTSHRCRDTGRRLSVRVWLHGLRELREPGGGEHRDRADAGFGEKLIGGHCVVAVGYDATKRLFFIRNSWGTGWGVNGYCIDAVRVPAHPPAGERFLDASVGDGVRGLPRSRSG